MTTSEFRWGKLFDNNRFKLFWGTYII
jgi:hypothetical protein